MITFISDIIPRLKRFSQKLDSETTLTNKTWVLISGEEQKKTVYIFSEKDNILRIAENGIIKKGKWDYLGNNMIEIDINDDPKLFKHVFVDEKVLALQLDGTNEYALLVNEPHYDNLLNSLNQINLFLEKNYLGNHQLISPPTNQKLLVPIIKPEQSFNPLDFPNLDFELSELKKQLEEYPKQNSVDILIAFAKNHVIKKEWFSINRKLANDISRLEMNFKVIESLFAHSNSNIRFQTDLENYIRSKLD